jgi:hypothetical protein
MLTGLLLLLAVPVELAFSVQRHAGQQESGATFGWLFGLVRLPLGRPGRRAPSRVGKHKAGRGKGPGPRRLMAMLRSEGFTRRLLGLARDLLRRIQIRELNLAVRLGLDDPADTGRLWALVGPVIALLPLPTAASLAVTPDFHAEAFDVDGRGRIRVIPLQLLATLVVFALSPTTFRALYAMRSGAR